MIVVNKVTRCHGVDETLSNFDKLSLTRFRRLHDIKSLY